MIRLRWLLAVFSIHLLFSFAFAEGTRTWEQSKFEELIKGTSKGVAMRSTGGLELAPAFKALSTTPSTYIWSIAADREGNLYAAAGSPARVYRITPDGKSTVIFEPQELQVQALVVDKNGVLYAATNPDGKVYKIEHRAVSADKDAKDKKPTAADSAWSSSVYFEPGTKYIWDLVLDDGGNLYVATGDHGEIFRVTPKGEHSVFFKSDEAHIRVMALRYQRQSDRGFRRQRAGLSNLAGWRRLCSLQRAQEGNHRPGHRQSWQHLRGGRRRKTRRERPRPVSPPRQSRFHLLRLRPAAGRKPGS